MEETPDREHQMTVIKDTAGNFFVGMRCQKSLPLRHI